MRRQTKNITHRNGWTMVGGCRELPQRVLQGDSDMSHSALEAEGMTTAACDMLAVRSV
jgi:hypothetical protein